MTQLYLISLRVFLNCPQVCKILKIILQRETKYTLTDILTVYTSISRIAQYILSTNILKYAFLYPPAY